MSLAPSVLNELRTRAGDKCELCSAGESCVPFELSHAPQPGAKAHAWVCGQCALQIESDSELDPKRWFCLQESGWSELAPVQVLSWRLLQRIDAAWATDLLEQLYLSEETLAWAKAGASSHGDDSTVRTLDSNGTLLAEGDSVTLIKDLDVKGGGFSAKRGTLVKNIHLIDDPENIEGRVSGMTLVLKTMFLKKAR